MLYGFWNSSHKFCFTITKKKKKKSCDTCCKVCIQEPKISFFQLRQFFNNISECLQISNLPYPWILLLSHLGWCPQNKTQVTNAVQREVVYSVSNIVLKDTLQSLSHRWYSSSFSHLLQASLWPLHRRVISSNTTSCSVSPYYKDYSFTTPTLHQNGHVLQ